MSEPAGRHRQCCSVVCNRGCSNQDIICSRCMNALAAMCKGKERADGYTARKRAERTDRGSYQCPACRRHHQTHTRPGPGAAVTRARAEHAMAALIEHRGRAWFDALITSWDPANGAQPRVGAGRSTRSA